VTLQYNALGMLLNKSDVGVYTYGASGPGATRPHALLSLAPVGGGAAIGYGYDANGNLETASGGKVGSIAYTSFNLPDSQNGIGGESNGASGGTARYTWVYDENHQRIKEVRTITGGSFAGTRTTWYLHPDNAGNLGFEQEVNAPTSPSSANPAATSNRHYLSFGGSTLGVLVSSGSLSSTPASTAPPSIGSVTLVKVEFWHKDHLGSLVATTDSQGNTTGRYAYDPIGKRRYANGSYDEFGNVVVDWSAAVNSGTDRGFTEHEHLDDVGIIHMNGRLFDPTVGRFFAGGSEHHDAEESAELQRYGYCLNSPLTCTDPTGLEFQSAPVLIDGRRDDTPAPPSPVLQGPDSGALWIATLDFGGDILDDEHRFSVQARAEVLRVMQAAAKYVDQMRLTGKCPERSGEFFLKLIIVVSGKQRPISPWTGANAEAEYDGKSNTVTVFRNAFYASDNTARQKSTGEVARLLFHEYVHSLESNKALYAEEVGLVVPQGPPGTLPV